MVSHIHPFTMTTITHHQCLFIEPMEVVKKNSRIDEKGKLLEYLRKVAYQFFTFCDNFMGFR